MQNILVSTEQQEEIQEIQQQEEPIKYEIQEIQQQEEPIKYEIQEIQQQEEPIKYEIQENQEEPIKYEIRAMEFDNLLFASKICKKQVERINLKQRLRFEQDKKFYKKRIINLLRQILNEKLEKIPEDLIHTGNLLIKSAISIFKEEDTKQLIQTELQDIPDIIPISSNVVIEQELEEYKEEEEEEDKYDLSMIARLNKKEVITLDGFVIKKNKEDDLPKIKDKIKKYKINTPEFKLKGIKPKKNKFIIQDDILKKDTDAEEIQETNDETQINKEQIQSNDTENTKEEEKAI
jgi:hypothetical protein